MKRILGLIVAAGLGMGWSASASGQMLVPYAGTPYSPGVTVNVPGFYGSFGTPGYGVGTYAYPGTTVYGTGYSGYVTPGAGFVGGGAYIPTTRVYSYGNGYPGYYYGPYRRGPFGRWRRGYGW